MVEFGNSLYGCWEMTAMKFLNSDGTWEEEFVYGGTSNFTQSGRINTFTRTSELAFGYSGTFVFSGNKMIITIDVCSIPELEKKQITRTVKKLTSERLTLSMEDEATGRYYEMDFKLLTNTFRH